MGEGEVAALKEALCNQYIVIRNLYNELEEERDASATAATEALSMILRLQREKAAEKMEACQYKRMAEEKMYHVEESLEILEEVMQQKEMEIASLKYQLQACKSKLSSIGFSIADVGEMRIYENASLSGSNASLNKTSFHGFVRRNISLPSLRPGQLCREMDIVDEDNPLAGQTTWRKIGDYTNYLSEKCEERKMPVLFEESVKQVEKLSIKVKELLQAKNGEEKVGYELSSASDDLDNMEEYSRSCSWYSAVSSNWSYDSTLGGMGTKLDGESVSCLPSQAEDSENIPGDPHISSCLEAESKGSTVHPFCVNGISEVPECYKGFTPGETDKKLLDESFFGTKKMTELCDFIPSEAIEYLFKDENWLNKSFTYTHSGSKLSKPRKGPYVNHGNKLSTPKKGDNNEYYHRLVDPKFGITTSQADIEQLKRRLQQLEDARSMKEEDSETGKKQLKLLREIYEQLNTIETHLKNSTPKTFPPQDESSLVSKKFPPQDESSLVSIMEAVLSFSI